MPKEASGIGSPEGTDGCELPDLGAGNLWSTVRRACAHNCGAIAPVSLEHTVGWAQHHAVPKTYQAFELNNIALPIKNYFMNSSRYMLFLKVCDFLNC